MRNLSSDIHRDNGGRGLEFNLDNAEFVLPTPCAARSISSVALDAAGLRNLELLHQPFHALVLLAAEPSSCAASADSSTTSFVQHQRGTQPGSNFPARQWRGIENGRGAEHPLD